MDQLDVRQQVQDDDYAFPYHYVPQFEPGFTQTYSWAWGLYYISAIEFVLDQVREIGPQSVIDVGTGDGRFVRELTRAFPAARVLGVDYSERAISVARALNPGLDLRCIDIRADSVGEKFDLVTLIEVFEHIPLALAHDFVAALRRLIKDDGRMLLTVPHANVPVSRKHFQHFTAESLQAYFLPHFEIERTVFLDARSRAVNLIRKVLQNEYFILAHWGIRNRLYRFYKRRYLVADEPRCGRIFMRLRPR